MPVHIGDKAPNLIVFEWVQGKPSNIDRKTGNVVLVEVFQVNCAGYFIAEIQQVVDMNSKYYEHGLRVLWIATAFEE